MLTAVSGINFGKGAKTSMIPNQLIMVSPKYTTVSKQKDKARKGDTKMLNKAVGLLTDKESTVTFEEKSRFEERSSTHKLASQNESQTDAVDMVVVDPPGMINKYESGGQSITTDTEAA